MLTDLHTLKPVAKTRDACRCSSCRGDIAKGTPSIVVTGTFEGQFWRERVCPLCSEAYTLYTAWMNARPGHFCSDEWESYHGFKSSFCESLTYHDWDMLLENPQLQTIFQRIPWAAAWLEKYKVTYAEGLALWMESRAKKLLAKVSEPVQNSAP